MAAIIGTECPLWVKSGHWSMSGSCPLYPPKADIAERPPWFKPIALLAARRWHDELVASAAALSDPRAIAKLQILRQTQSHFGQALAGATDRNRAWRQTGICVDERVFDIARRNAEWLLEISIFGWDFHCSAGLAHRLEIGTRRLTRAGTVAIPLVED